MRIKQTILVCLSIILLIGCSEDDNKPSTPEVDISGNWNLTAYNFDGTRRIIGDLDVNTLTFSATAWDINLATVFSEAENNYSASGTYNLDYSVINNSGQEFFFPDFEDIDDVGTWSRNNSFLGITIDGVLRQASISMLTDTTLKYKVSSSAIETDENNQSVSISRTEFYTYTRPAN